MSARSVVVTGGAGGIGAAVAAALSRDGWSVVVADFRETDAARVAGRLSGSRAVGLDVRDPASWTGAVAAATSLAPLRGLVNAAGVLGPGSVLDVDLAAWEEVMAVNVRGSLLGLRAVAPAMEAAGGGSVVNLGSVVGFTGTPGLAAYGASKWAVRGLTRTAAIELGPRGIRVNAIMPGPISTPLAEHPHPDRTAWFAGLPAGRQGDPDDVAEAARYLLSDSTVFTTGTELVVDGGLLARGNLPPR